jgi:hypothetical protein
MYRKIDVTFFVHFLAEGRQLGCVGRERVFRPVDALNIFLTFVLRHFTAVLCDKVYKL